MGTIFAVSIASSIVLTVLFLCYRWLVAPLNQPLTNRVTLLMVYVVSLVAWPITGLSLLSKGDMHPHIADIEFDLSGMTATVVTPHAEPVSLFGILMAIYLIGVIVSLTVIALTVILKIHQIKRLDHIDILGHRVYVSDECYVSPFSLFGMIVIGQNDIDHADIIVAHEAQHIARRHSFDLVLAQCVAIFQWYNPTAWLMMRELKAVHEFEVDRRLLESGINIKQYQFLLIKKAVGARFPSLANSLNHSNLKNRITMMQKSKEKGARKWRGLVMIPAVAVSLAVFNIDSVASVLDDALSSRLPDLSSAKVNQNAAEIKMTDALSVNEIVEVNDFMLDSESRPSDESAQVSDCTEPIKSIDPVEPKTHKFGAKDLDGSVDAEITEMAKFKGGDAEMMRWVATHMQYPQEAIAKNEEGRVVVKFIVEADGSVSSPAVVKSVSPSLDAEAIRVISEMPDFIPAKADGKPVAMSFALPVSFKLQGDVKQNDNPTLFVDGMELPYGRLNDFKPDQIESMNIDKSDPAYPNGRIDIKLIAK